MKRKDWTVGQYGIRPVGKPDRCLYCDSEIGDQHKEDCVIRSKTVVINFNIEMVVDIPEYWTKENIEFRYNEGSWCADNLINMLDRGKNNCLCPYVKAEFIREATEEDEENWGLCKVNELEN